MSYSTSPDLGPSKGFVEPHRGTLILILGIVGLLFCQPAGIAAWIMGSGDLKKIRAGTMDPAGENNTQIGMVLGIISTILLILSFIAFVVGVAIVIVMMTSAAAHVEQINQVNQL